MAETRSPKGKKITLPSPSQQNAKEEDLSLPEMGDRFKDYTTGKILIVKRVNKKDGSVIMAAEDGPERRIIGVETLFRVCEKIGNQEVLGYIFEDQNHG